MRRRVAGELARRAREIWIVSRGQPLRRRKRMKTKLLDLPLVENMVE